MTGRSAAVPCYHPIRSCADLPASPTARRFPSPPAAAPDRRLPQQSSRDSLPCARSKTPSPAAKLTPASESTYRHPPHTAAYPEHRRHHLKPSPESAPLPKPVDSPPGARKTADRSCTCEYGPYTPGRSAGGYPWRTFRSNQSEPRSEKRKGTGSKRRTGQIAEKSVSFVFRNAATILLRRAAKTVAGEKYICRLYSNIAPRPCEPVC